MVVVVVMVVILRFRTALKGVAYHHDKSQLDTRATKNLPAATLILANTSQPTNEALGKRLRSSRSRSGRYYMPFTERGMYPEETVVLLFRFGNL